MKKYFSDLIFTRPHAEDAELRRGRGVAPCACPLHKVKKEKGNIFLAIFGAVAMVGVIGAGVMTFSKGPVQGSLNLIRKNNANVDITMAGQMAIMAATNTAASMDEHGKVFVSSTASNGNLGGLNGADATCQTLAAAANLAGTYKAWLSDGANSPLTRFTQLSVPYKLVNGTTIATNWADLIDGTIAAAIGKDENGVTRTDDVWTNTSGLGNISSTGSASICGFWTDSANPAVGRYGSASATNSGWSYTNGTSCTASKRLYCFQQNTTKTVAGDCDGDGYVEPPEWRTGATVPSGGGLIPNSVGVAKKDPWGAEYGYCVWDNGPVIQNTSCQSVTGTNKRLQGSDSKKYPVIAVISAGPDGIFTTTCRNFATADVNSDGDLEDAGDLALVSKAAAIDDDILYTYSYSDAMASSGGLWKLKSADTGTAYINKKVEAAGATVTGTGMFERMAALGGDFIDVVSGLKLGDPASVTACNATNSGMLRRAASGYSFELCNGASWAAPGGGISTSIDGFSDGVSYSPGSVFGGLDAGLTASGYYETGLGIGVMRNAGANRNTGLGFNALANLGGSGGSATAVGWKAGGFSSSTAIGYEALMSGAGGQANTGFGYQAAKRLIGDSNTAAGAMAMLACVNCNRNAAIGTEAGKSFNGSSTGINANNVLAGYQAGLYPTTMTGNAGIGSQTMQVSTGIYNYNVAAGSKAMQGTASTGTTQYNVAVGASALKNITTGSNNTALGNNTSSGTTTGSDCVTIGNAANPACANGNIGIGYQTLASVAGGTRNVAAGGLNTGYGITTGTDNTLLGSKTYGFNTAAGSNNTAAGFQALTDAVAGDSRNTAAGYRANAKSGNDNTAIGYGALSAGAASVAQTTAFGHAALQNATAGAGNTAVGNAALTGLTSATNNTAFGDSAGYTLTNNSNNNVFVGASAGYAVASNGGNVGIGYRSLYTMATAGFANSNVAVGYEALKDASSNYNVCAGSGSCAAPGNNNVALGYQTLTGSGATGNVALGHGALKLLTSGAATPGTAAGYFALGSATTAGKSTAFGSLALSANATGSENTAVGTASLQNSTVSGNTAFGTNALKAATTSVNNTAFGYLSIQALTNGGDNNTAFGQITYGALTSGSNNSAFAGSSTQVSLTNTTAFRSAVSDGLSNASAIGRDVTTSNTVGFGLTTATSINGQVNFTATSDRRVKKDIRPTDLGLDFILRLKPVSYRMIDGNGRLDYGFVAQDVEEALAGRKTNMVTRRNDSMETYRLRSDDLLAPLVRAVQEQQKALEDLEQEADSLR